MLVDVVRLRQQGRRLPPAQLRASEPVRGRLWLTNFRPAVDNSTTPLLAALLSPTLSGHGLLPPLDWACVRSIRDGQLLISGIEDLGAGGKQERNFRQSWWCRVVLAPDEAPLPPTRWSAAPAATRARPATGRS